MVYFDARSEYSNQLCQCIVPAIFKLFMDLLKKAREDVGSESRRMLYQYQVLLNEIPDWNMDKVYREINHLKDAIQCEYLEELITAVFLAHTKVLMAIRMSNADLNVNLSVPKVDHFLFKVLCVRRRSCSGSRPIYSAMILGIWTGSRICGRRRSWWKMVWRRQLGR